MNATFLQTTAAYFARPCSHSSDAQHTLRRSAIPLPNVQHQRPPTGAAGTIRIDREGGAVDPGAGTVAANCQNYLNARVRFSFCVRNRSYLQEQRSCFLCEGSSGEVKGLMSYPDGYAGGVAVMYQRANPCSGVVRHRRTAYPSHGHCRTIETVPWFLRGELSGVE